MSHKVFIYCDDASHSQRVAVTNFLNVDQGSWNERYTSTAAQGGRESGTTLVDDQPFDDATLAAGLGAMMDAVEGKTVRSRYQLVCRKCKRRPVTAREENLFSALNTLEQHNVSEASLTLLAAILREQVGT